MEKAKVAISINKKTLDQLDRLVQNRVFANRSKAIQEAVEEKLQKLGRTRLADECSKLNKHEEMNTAEEGLEEQCPWPEY